MLQTQNPQKKTQQHTVCAGALCVVRFHEISSCHTARTRRPVVRAHPTPPQAGSIKCRARVPRLALTPPADWTCCSRQCGTRYLWTVQCGESPNTRPDVDNFVCLSSLLPAGRHAYGQCTVHSFSLRRAPSRVPSDSGASARIYQTLYPALAQTQNPLICCGSSTPQLHREHTALTTHSLSSASAQHLTECGGFCVV